MTRIYLRLVWDRLRASYWYVPAVMALLALLLSELVIWCDALIPNAALIGRRFIISQDPEQARITLAGLATTVLGTAGVVFSLLTVPMSLAASQFGSRLLRLNLRDKTTQFELGVFVGTFTFCLAAALSIPPASIEPEALQLTPSIALFLCLASFGSLLALIHHIGTALQAPNVAASASAELRAVIRSVAAESGRQSAVERKAEDEAVPGLVEIEGRPIYAEGVGYIQQVDPGLALPVAQARGLVIRLVRKPGDFVRTGDVVGLVWPPHAADEAVMRRIRGCYRLGNGRTPTQDIEYAVNQLVEVAVRAMSPAINDPFTAMTCLDHLGAGLVLYAEQVAASPYLYDSENRLRVIVDPLTFGELMDAAFNMIRRAGRDNADVLRSMLDAIDTIAAKASAERQAELLRHVRLVEAEVQANSSIDWDQERVSRRSAELVARLQGPIPTVRLVQADTAGIGIEQS
jgi:uncharacterized membrane protein